MSDTINTGLPAGDYIEIAAAGTAGFITVVGSGPIEYVESAAAPASTLGGHRLKKNSEGVSFDVTGKLYARAFTSVSSKVAVTVAG